MTGSGARSSNSGRHAAMLIVFMLGFTAIGARLVWIQAIAAPEYAAKATAQRMRNIEFAPRRGTIYDREGEPLAVSVEARTVFASPNRIADKQGAAAALASTLGGEPGMYLEKLQRDTGFVYLRRKVDLERARALEDLGIEGIGMLEDFRRVYPSGDLACQVLGFVGVDDEGLAGIERHYDDVLRGRPGVIVGERDPQGRPIPGGIQKTIEPVHGHDVVLTIDKDIQYQAQVELVAAVERWGAESGSAIVMNPRTGEIYAMATVPGFDPNDYARARPEAIRNRPLTDAYEPGSTLKCLTAAAVIERGLYTPDSRFDLPSAIRVGGRTINEAHGRKRVRWSLTDIMAHSSNVGTVKLGLRLGRDGLYDSFAAFGLTETPGTDFPGTTKGWLPPTSQWSSSSIGTIPFGQGVSVTQVQLARAVGAIANDGVLTTPHFLLDIPDSPDADVVWPSRRAVNSKTADQVTRILEAVVTSGTGESARVAGYTVAGKTGTAQKARPDRRGYRGGGYISSFIGYLPAEDPQVLVCVTIDRPRNAIYGGVVAAPTFAKLAAFSVSHLRIPPSSGRTAGKRPGIGSVSDGETRP